MANTKKILSYQASYSMTRKERTPGICSFKLHLEGGENVIFNVYVDEYPVIMDLLRNEKEVLWNEKEEILFTPE